MSTTSYTRIRIALLEIDSYTFISSFHVLPSALPFSERGSVIVKTTVKPSPCVLLIIQIDLHPSSDVSVPYQLWFVFIL
jgi:hypothetical protein